MGQPCRDNCLPVVDGLVVQTDWDYSTTICFVTLLEHLCLVVDVISTVGVRLLVYIVNCCLCIVFSGL